MELLIVKSSIFAVADWRINKKVDAKIVKELYLLNETLKT
jgi:hypothetical protein